MLAEGPQWIVVRTSGESKPIPNAMVAITTRHVPFAAVKFSIMFFTDYAVQAVYISTRQCFESLSAPCGKYIFSIRECLKNK